LKEKLKIRPYARLLTMLGEQLIKNERIALVELIKNAYDADADWVKISFNDFGENFEILPESKIIIEDNGEGMTFNIIENAWMNPATPNKFVKKGNKLTKGKKRVIQGEKGIGRFAMLKLGQKIQIITRPISNKEEYVIDYDLSRFDGDFLTENGSAKAIYLDEIPISVNSQKAKIITDYIISVGYDKVKRGNSGTRIEITNLKGKWSTNKIKSIYDDVSKMESTFTKLFGKKEQKKNTFRISLEYDGKEYRFAENDLERLHELLENSAVNEITKGFYDNKNNKYRFLLDDKKKKISFDDPIIRGLNVCRKRFENSETGEKRYPVCGSFEYTFYIFDLSYNAPPKYQLDKEDKILIKRHRIYLYRDGIRVYPYGDPDNDWLQIDIYRGIIGASHFLSNDQIVGFVEITKKQNTDLKDKTNREGLIEEGEAVEDFIAVVQTFLSYIRKHPYDRYRNDLKNKKVQDIFKMEQVQEEFSSLKKHLEKTNDKKGISLISRTEKQYKAERQYLVRRVETTEELAGIGLSVEIASHDIMSIMSNILLSLDNLILDCMHEDIDSTTILEELKKTKGMLSFVESQLKDIQLLFRSSKQRRKNIRVKEMLDKVVRIYNRLLKKKNIELNIDETGSPLIAKCTEAVLLQLLINLFDNSIFWIGQFEKNKRDILITLDGSEGKLIFSDNGPGVHPDDKPYIFEAFYSGKGEEGRGLGLYIARQLLERNGYTIELADVKKDKKLPGANFVVSFVMEEE